MSEKKQVQLNKPLTWAGENYPAGTVEIPAAAADYAEKKGIGKILKNGSVEKAADVSQSFEPLTIRETVERMNKGDFTDDVLDSMKVHREVIEKAAKSGKSLEEFLKENSEDDAKTKNITGLPEDFPMRHLFEKLGFKSVEEVQAKSREELIALNGIAEKTADKALNYGK